MDELVSVIIPTYNRKESIKKSIDSVFSQTYKSIEVIIVDDCSTDGTLEYISEIYGDCDNLIYVLNENNLGAGGARNVGATYANGKYIAFQDSDDEWMPEKLEKQMSLFEGNSDVGMVYCAIKRVLKNGVFDCWPKEDISLKAKCEDFFKTALLKPLCGTPTMVIRKDLFLEIGGFNTRLKSLEDYEFTLRFSKDYNVMIYDEPLIVAYESEESVGKRSAAKVDTMVYIMRNYYEYIKKYDYRKRKMLAAWAEAEENDCLDRLEELLPSFAGDDEYLTTYLQLEAMRRKEKKEGKRFES